MPRYSGPDGVYLVIDTADPYTPALVYSTKHPQYNASFDAAADTGLLSGFGAAPGDVALTLKAVEWLHTQADVVEKAYDIARPDGWEG
jgi:hypothetical protein